MKIYSHAEIYQIQSYGGINHIFDEVFPRICAMDDQVQINFLVNDTLKSQLPSHPQISHTQYPNFNKYIRPSKIFRNVSAFLDQKWMERMLGDGKGEFWHPTYFSPPPSGWQGYHVVTVYDMIYERYPEMFNATNRRKLLKLKKNALASSTMILSISETTKEDVLDYYPVSSEKVRVVSLAASSAFRILSREEKNGYSQLEKNPFILYVGSRAEYKNFTNLLKAYALWSTNPEVELIVVGRKWTRAEKYLLSELGIEHRVTLKTNVDTNALCYYYNQAQAFVYPSLYEGFGIPLLEAMKCGCLILASDIPSTREVAGNIPLYFDPVDVGDIVRILDHLISETHQDYHVQAGLSRAANYSWDKSAHETLKVYRELAGWQKTHWE